MQEIIVWFADSIFAPIANNILTKPEFFIGIIVFVGYLLLKRPIMECIAGFIKTTVGFMILSVGSGGLISTFRPILTGLNAKFNLNASVVDPYFGLNAANAAISGIGESISFAMVSLLFAFSWNIILVALKKYTKCRVLFLTGHVMVQMSTVFTWIIFLLFPSLRNFTGALVVGLILGTYQTVTANMNVEFIDEITEGGGFALGHHQQFMIFIVDKFGRLFDKEGKNKRMEDVELPGWMSILNDNIVATSIIMTIFFGTIIFVLGKEYMMSIDPSFTAKQFFAFYLISKCFAFTVYFTILLKGVAIFITEITESFRGISEKLIPGAIPGIDCPAIYGYTTGNTVIWGFLWTSLAAFASVILLVLFKSPLVIIPGFVPLFFDGGTVAVFANKRAGAKGAAIFAAIVGFIDVLLGAVATRFFMLSQYGGWIGMSDQSTLWLLFGGVLKYMGVIGIGVLVVGLLIIPQIQYSKSKKEKYFKYGDV